MTQKDLSLQLHPNDQLKERHNSFGKNEMWYIMNADADQNSSLDFLKILTRMNISNISKMVRSKAYFITKL